MYLNSPMPTQAQGSSSQRKGGCTDLSHLQRTHVLGAREGEHILVVQRVLGRSRPRGSLEGISKAIDKLIQLPALPFFPYRKVPTGATCYIACDLLLKRPDTQSAFSAPCFAGFGSLHCPLPVQCLPIATHTPHPASPLGVCLQA